MADLPRGHTELSRDDREIAAVYLEQGGGWHVGDANGTTKIVAYDENGEMAHVPWLAIFNRDGIAVRLPARTVTVNYKPKDGF